MPLSRNQAELAVALLAALGIRTLVVPATETLVTGGLRAWMPANVSARLTACSEILAQTEQ